MAVAQKIITEVISAAEADLQLLRAQARRATRHAIISYLADGGTSERFRHRDHARQEQTKNFSDKCQEAAVRHAQIERLFTASGVALPPVADPPWTRRILDLPVHDADERIPPHDRQASLEDDWLRFKTSFIITT